VAPGAPDARAPHGALSIAVDHLGPRLGHDDGGRLQSWRVRFFFLWGLVLAVRQALAPDRPASVHMDLPNAKPSKKKEEAKAKSKKHRKMKKKRRRPRAQSSGGKLQARPQPNGLVLVRGCADFITVRPSLLEFLHRVRGDEVGAEAAVAARQEPLAMAELRHNLYDNKKRKRKEEELKEIRHKKY